MDDLMDIKCIITRGHLNQSEAYDIVTCRNENSWDVDDANYKTSPGHAPVFGLYIARLALMLG